MSDAPPKTRKSKPSKAEQAGAGINLRSLTYSPDRNPLIEPSEIRLRKKYVRTAGDLGLQDPQTGEIVAVSGIHVVKLLDEASFVKVFAEGVKAAFDLSATGAKVFRAVLDIYERTPMTGGYAEAIELFWFGEGLNGHAIGMSEKTFQRGLKELLAKQFISPRIGASYWVNPALFFKGDRARFVTEYRRDRTAKIDAERSRQSELPLGGSES